MGAEQMRLEFLGQLRADFDGWTFAFYEGERHPWEAKRTLIHELGGFSVIKAADAEILRELLDAARDIDVKLNGQP